MQTQHATHEPPMRRGLARTFPLAIRTDAADDGMVGLAALGTVASLDRGAAAYREGDPALHWYKVVSGTGCTTKPLPDGRRQIGTFLQAGDFFGFEALNEYGFAAEAITDMVVIRYPKQRTEALAHSDSAISRRFREMACRSLTTAYERLLTLGRHGRYADVIAVDKTDPGREDPPFGLPADLVLASGRPVIIVPFAGMRGTIGQRVVVAWNASREAARAVADAMPILAQARKVDVLAVPPV